MFLIKWLILQCHMAQPTAANYLHFNSKGPFVSKRLWRSWSQNHPNQQRSIMKNHLSLPPFFERAPSNRAGWKHRETSLPFLLLRSHSAELLWCRWLPEGRRRPDTGTTCGSPTIHHSTDFQTTVSFFSFINRTIVSWQFLIGPCKLCRPVCPSNLDKTNPQKWSH